jgi:hypothetical protein
MKLGNQVHGPRLPRGEAVPILDLRGRLLVGYDETRMDDGLVEAKRPRPWGR